MRGCPCINLSRICSRMEGTPAMRRVSSTTGVMIVTGSALLIRGSRCLEECILTKWAQYTISTSAVQCSMFNSTHTFVGLAVARTGMDRWVPRATITAVIAANLPDIDIVSALAGTPTYLEYHRGITHSIAGIPLLALGLAAVMYLFSENFWKTYVVALIAMATHPLLDLANTYGLRPFLPMDGTWYYGDLLPIIDPYLDAILLVGILAGETFKDSKRLMTWVSVGLMVLYLGARFELRNLSISQLETLAAKTPGTEKWGVSPDILNPLVCDGIIQAPRQIVKVSIDPLDE